MTPRHLLFAAALIALPTHALESPPPDQPAKFLSQDCLKVRYPGEAVAHGLQGITELRWETSESGEVLNAQVAKSSGHAVLDEAALGAIKTCKFQPATKAGQPVPDLMQLEIKWGIEDPGWKWMYGPNQSTCPLPRPSGKSLPKGLVTSAVRLEFDRGGTVANAEIVRGTGDAGLDAETLKAFKQCKFDPQLRHRSVSGADYGVLFVPSAVIEYEWRSWPW